MNNRMICRIEIITNVLNTINYYVLFSIFFIIVGPFVLLFMLISSIYKWLRTQWIRFRHPEDFEFEETASVIIGKIMDREMEFSDYPALLDKVKKESDKLHYFHFFRKRSFDHPFNTLLYVENKYNSTMHKFIEQSPLYNEWCAWHGWNVVIMDKETIKKDMFLPEKFDTHFNHGFLWYSNSSNGVVSTYISGDIFYYYEISTTTDVGILHQMHAIMSKIYKGFEWQLV